MYVVVVDLRWERSRSSRTGVQIESNKDLRASMHAAVRTDKFTFTKTHVRLICQWRSCAGGSVCSSAAAANMGQTHEAIEIGYLRRVVNAGQRIGWIEWIVMSKDSIGRECHNAPRNWIGTPVEARSRVRRLRLDVLPEEPEY